MDKTEYLTALQNKLKSAGRGNKYSLTCCDYASNLLTAICPFCLTTAILHLFLGFPHLILEDYSIQLMTIAIMK